MDLKTLFEAAAAKSKTITNRPSNDTLLQLYALYKQATEGDNNGKKPGMFDLVGQAKYDAWSKLKGKSSADAMQMYVDLVDSLTK
ncbi:MAG: acyl-CoA-binding protein [Microscillaceae bacterium]|jgi:acyl-CoA-binding protein|nr:acyl-CoA-binding protein [Microscillaceae bacterium]